MGVEGFAHAEILHGLAVIFQRLPGGQSGNVLRSEVIRHRCGFPFYLNGLLNTEQTRHAMFGHGINCVDTISGHRANTVNLALRSVLTLSDQIPVLF
ncbi:hypothetical protein DMX02_20235 [Pseudomonas jessenii]|nr:hypothetical protein DMX02_20235 [Pseudomonas jessenii]